MNMTPWFDGRKFKRARRGVYMLMSGNSVGYQKWDGKGWGPWFHDASDAAKHTRPGDYAHPSYQNDNWCGLMTKDGK